jgi:hypothetical protein
LVQVENLTHVKPQQAILDQGFRDSTHHPQGVEVLIAPQPQALRLIKRLLKRLQCHSLDIPNITTGCSASSYKVKLAIAIGFEFRVSAASNAKINSKLKPLNKN